MFVMSALALATSSTLNVNTQNIIKHVCHCHELAPDWPQFTSSWESVGTFVAESGGLWGVPGSSGRKAYDWFGLFKTIGAPS